MSIDLAPDAIHTVFAKLLEQPREIANPRAYLKRAVYNTALNIIKLAESCNCELSVEIVEPPDLSYSVMERVRELGQVYPYLREYFTPGPVSPAARQWLCRHKQEVRRFVTQGESELSNE